MLSNLFTSRVIAERLQGTEGDEQVAAFVKQRKQLLVQQLEQTTAWAVDGLLADLDIFRPNTEGTSAPLPPQRPDIGQRVE